MKFFSQIQTLLAAGTITLAMSNTGDGNIRVVVTQNGEGPLAIPLPLTASAAELDEKFIETVSSFSNARKSLEEQLASTQAILDAAKADSAAKATKAIVATNASALGGDNDEDDENGACAVPASTVVDKPASAGINLFDFGN